jgi:hypothetical protein
MIELIQRAKKYINSLYIDYGDLNDKAEEQIKQAFIDGSTSAAMNTSDALVKKVISYKPKYQDKKYWIKVEYLCYGLTSTAYLMFDTEEEAKSIKKGYKFPLIFC